MNQSETSQDRTDLPQWRCRQCGAENASTAARCWLCHAGLPVAGSETVADQSGMTLAPHGPPLQFSLATILLVMTLIAVCFGAFGISPGLGLAVAAFAAPALIRTLVVGAQQKRAGQRLSIADKLTAFLASLGIMILVAVAAIVAFQIACWGTCGIIAAADSQSLVDEAGFIASVVVGSAAAIAVGIWILWATRPRRR